MLKLSFRVQLSSRKHLVNKRTHFCEAGVTRYRKHAAAVLLHARQVNDEACRDRNSRVSRPKIEGELERGPPVISFQLY